MEYSGIPVSDLRSSHKDMGVNPFYNIPKYSIDIPRPIIPPKCYPANPKTRGEHIRKKRLDCNLKQSEIARIIGVSESTIWNWEHGSEPDVKHVPSIIKYLGYVPFDKPENIGISEKLRYYKLINGLTIKQLAKEIGCNHEQLMDWIGGKVRPSKRNLERIRKFVEAL